MEVKVINRFPKGVVTLPPSKSLGHRAVICAALAALGGGGASAIRNLGASEDIDATVCCMAALGAAVRREGDVLAIEAGLRPQGEEIQLDCAESGSTLRFLLPLAALTGETFLFRGRGRLMQRPLGVYEEIFAQAGVLCERGGDTVRVRGPLKAGVYRLPGDVSSQFITGLLLALPLAAGDSELHLTTALESRGYVDLTLDVMRRFGVAVQQESERLFRIPGGQRYRAADYTVEGDYSQAAFFLGAAALGRPVACAGLLPGSLQGDAEILRILERMGARITERDGALHVQAERLRAVMVDASQIPDLVPPVAALCCFCEGTSRIVNAGRLRLKESDRLRALAAELGKLGARVEELEDGLVIAGAQSLSGGRVDAHGDHRIAMALALAAIRCKKPVELSGWRHVNKSYPAFWEHFEKEAQYV